VDCVHEYSIAPAVVGAKSRGQTNKSALHHSLSWLPLSYEPELFPGLIYRMVRPRIVLLIFVSGKVVLTGEVAMTSSRFSLLSMHVPGLLASSSPLGAKERSEIMDAFSNIYPILKSFKKT